MVSTEMTGCPAASLDKSVDVLELSIATVFEPCSASVVLTSGAERGSNRLMLVALILWPISPNAAAILSWLCIETDEPAESRQRKESERLT